MSYSAQYISTSFVNSGKDRIILNYYRSLPGIATFQIPSVIFYLVLFPGTEKCSCSCGGEGYYKLLQH
jgi:hypothetical protein